MKMNLSEVESLTLHSYSRTIEERPLVSIITPCYNHGKVVHRLFDSILAQTYALLEFIFVNDGSTDDSEKVFLAYELHFKQKGIRTKYIKQANKGLGAAINAGLQEVSGAYFCWPDADDFLAPASIEKRLAVFMKHPEYGCVTSDAHVADESSPCTPISRIAVNFPHSQDERQFGWLLKGESIFCSGCHMLSTKAFRATHATGLIYPARRGQNWQLLLPVYHGHRRYFLNEPLYTCVAYTNSMSRGDKDKDKALFRTLEHEEILLKTLDMMTMPEEERKQYILSVKLNYARNRLRIAIAFADKALAKAQYECVKQLHGLTLKDRLLYIPLTRKGRSPFGKCVAPQAVSDDMDDAPL